MFPTLSITYPKTRQRTAEATGLTVTPRVFNTEMELSATVYISCWRAWWDRLGIRSQSRFLFCPVLLSSRSWELTQFVKQLPLSLGLSSSMQSLNLEWVSMSDGYCSASEVKNQTNRKKNPKPTNQKTPTPYTTKKTPTNKQTKKNPQKPPTKPNKKPQPPQIIQNY